MVVCFFPAEPKRSAAMAQPHAVGVRPFRGDGAPRKPFGDAERISGGLVTKGLRDPRVTKILNNQSSKKGGVIMLFILPILSFGAVLVLGFVVGFILRLVREVLR